MTRILTTTALILALGTPVAVAQTEMLRDKIEDQFEEIDVSTLTDEQVRALYAAMAGEDSTADLNNRVDAIVADSQYEMDEEAFMADAEYMGRVGASNDIRNVVADYLDQEAIDADVDTLTDEQVAALYIQLTSGETTDATQIEAIIQ